MDDRSNIGRRNFESEGSHYNHGNEQLHGRNANGNDDQGASWKKKVDNDGDVLDVWTLKIKQINETHLELKDVDPQSTILDLKRRVDELTNIPVNKQRMIFRGKVLENAKKLDEYSIKHMDCIHLLQRATTRPVTSTTTTGQNSTERRDVTQRRGLNFDHNELNRMINEQLSRNYTRSSRHTRLGRPFATGDNVEHIYQGLATLETLEHAIDRRNYNMRVPWEQSNEDERDWLDELAFCLDDSCLVDETNEWDFLEPRNRDSESVEEKVNSESGMNAFFEEASDDFREFKVGQWIDCLDTVNQWLEATVTDVSEDKKKIKVHYNGWGTRWDETIDSDSPRIARFRTKTKNNAQVPNFSPTISHWVDNVPKLKASNDLNDLVPQVYLSTARVMYDLERLVEDKYAEHCPNISTAIAQKREDVLELAPKLDIIGRALSDLGQALANRPNYVRRYEVLRVKSNLISLMAQSILPFNLKASVERDRTIDGSWNLKEREELLQRELYDDHMLSMSHRPNELHSGGRRNRSLELHLHAIVASDLRLGDPAAQTENETLVPPTVERSLSIARQSQEGAVPDEPEPEDSPGSDRFEL